MQTSPTQPARRALLTGKPASVRRAVPQGLVLPPATSAITPFRVETPQALLDDLKLRLSMTRWPEQETGSGWSQGVPLKRMKDVAQHWQQRYDWRRAEAQLNAFPQFRTEIDAVGIHFLHVRSKHENALPLILTHGWPGSVFEFLKVIGPLVDPTAHGGKAEDAFHVVVPSLPGFGFSDKPVEKGWNVVRIAKAWGTLMARLGYSKWVAQGGDWGAGVTTALGHIKPAGLAGIHLNWQFVFPEKMPATLSADEQRAVDGVGRFLSSEYGYFNEQATRPQTVGEVLSSTPVGQAAWIYEKFQAWSDNGGDVENVLTRDEMLDDISLYWLTNTAASSARIYWENSPSSFSGGRLDLPVAVSVFPKEIYRAPRSWAEATYPQMIYWNEVERGGHFAAFEQPALFVAELRAGFAKLR
ncbi:epoxide hydrolase family protein [Duganella radicis]|uniref:Alpha/beta fold hydrolase n=1 Tax=Duganella radicis TaxID=551988 RepID=A0A6L6PFB0_9BURK|nr:epoxide hydrolase [Duganella radicis]MTV37379.1 alpha/beta fold hydrolase [Duganella radicis]